MPKQRRTIYVEEGLIDYFEDRDDDTSFNQKVESIMRWAIEEIENDPEVSLELIRWKQLQREKRQLEDEIEAVEGTLEATAGGV